MSTVREIRQIIPSHATADGDGVKIRRVAGFNNTSFSPFLMVDELKSDQRADYVGGFPPHPHRGIETLTYMLTGHFQHRTIWTTLVSFVLAVRNGWLLVVV